MRWYCVWPWPKGQGQIWHHQWIPQMLFPIGVQYISYVYLAPMKSRELGPEHSTQSVARYASACGQTNPGPWALRRYHAHTIINYDLIWPLYHRPWVGNKTAVVTTILNWMTSKKLISCSFWDTNTQNLKSISQSSTELWPKNVLTIYGGQSAILNQTTSTKSHRFLFWVTNAQNLKSISPSSTE